MKRLLSLLLVLTMVIGLSAAALAAEDSPDETPADTAEEVVSGDEEVPAEEVSGDETAADEAPAEELPAEEAPAEEVPAEEDIPAEETDAEEAPVPDDAGETETVISDGMAESCAAALPYDSDTLLACYLNSALGDDLFEMPEGPVLDGGSAAGDRLTGENKNLYDQLKTAVQNIAAGKSTSTLIELTIDSIDTETRYTAADLGISGSMLDSSSSSYKLSSAARSALNSKLDIDIDLVMSALLVDCPYDLYWYGNEYSYSYPVYSLTFNKTLNTDTVRFSKKIFTVELAIDSTYSAGEDTVKTGAAAVGTAVTTAASVVSAAASKTDYEKLVYYRNWICNAVSYNTSAYKSGASGYGNLNPWNVIWVFDGNSSTNVVCEGYSKAFQYLCDLTDWDGDVSCLYVTGTMGSIAHGWNIVSISGKNYMADITNCDAGMFGAPDKLFLVGGSGSVSGGYTFCGKKYSYDTSAMLKLYSNDMLTLADSNYDPNSHTHTYNTVVTKEATCTEAGSCTRTCSGCGAVRTETIPALGHSYTEEITKQATCTEAGSRTLTCSRCGDIKTETIAAKGHSYTSTVTRQATLTETGIRTYTCSVCGNTYTEVIPKVTVSFTGTGWTKDSLGNWYYFSDSIMYKGKWVSYNGSWYYFDKETGVMVKDCTAAIDGKTYLFASTGRMLTGWQKLSGSWYYFGSAMYKDQWLKYNGSWYYFDKETGVMVKGGMVAISGKTYLFDSSGRMLTGWQKLNGSWYYFGSAMLKEQWLKYNGSWYYFNGDGVMVKGGMVPAADSKTYLFDSAGRMLTGWQKIGSVWYYFGSAMYKDQWLKYNGSWYYFNAGGAMVTGSGIRCVNSSGAWSDNNFGSTGKWLGAA